MVPGMHVEHISTKPSVWVVDGAVSEELLSLVDEQFAIRKGTCKNELRNGKSLSSRSLEFQVDAQSRSLFETVASLWGLTPEQPCQSFVVSDICGEGQSPHVDHINLDDLKGCKMDFLDLRRQSASASNPKRVVPTVSVIVYFNSVGGLRFPHLADELGTVAAKRGRMVMFQNYVEELRPAHDALAAHCGIYCQRVPKRILVMGILANETPSFSSCGSATPPSTRSLIYCPGTQQDPLRHDAPSYDCYRSPEELQEINAAREREAWQKYEGLREKEEKPKSDLLASLEVTVNYVDGAEVLTFLCRSLAGTELCSVTGACTATIGWLRAEIKQNLDKENAYNVVLSMRDGEVLRPDADSTMLGELRPLCIDEVKTAFAKADLNKDGFLDKAEAKAMLKELACELPDIMSDDEIEQLFESVDVDKDGRLNVSEFIDWCFGAKMFDKVSHDELKEQLQTGS